MTRYEIVPATKAHAAVLATMLRNKDALEVQAMGYEPLPGLLSSMRASEAAHTGLVDGRPVCMFGYSTATLTSDEAQPWLLGTDEMARHATAFLRRNRPFVLELRKRFRKLHGWVYEQNHSSLRWLKWLGFTVLPEIVEIGPNKVRFHPFVWEK